MSMVFSLSHWSRSLQDGVFVARVHEDGFMSKASDLEAGLLGARAHQLEVHRQ